MKVKRVAIVGAGMAGLGAAWRLREAAAEVVVFEKSRGFGGRVASRTREGVRVDVGANYFRMETGGLLARVVREVAGEEGLVEIERPVWVLGADGSISPGDERHEAGGKWCYADGISTLAKRLATASGSEVRREVRVGSVVRSDGRWELRDESGESLGAFDAVLWTAPLPQVAEVMRASAVACDWWGDLVGVSEGVEYRRQFSVVLGYRAAPDREGDYYGLVNLDGGHDVGWLSFEDAKAGRVAAGESVLVVQMADGWTRAWWEREREAVAAEVARVVAGVLGEAWGVPDWWDVQRWKFSHPAGPGLGVSEVVLAAERDGWFLAGDGVVGKGRVGLALESGVSAAERIGEVL